MKETMILNRKEQRRLVVLNQVGMGKMSGKEAAEVLEFSLRHVRRSLAAYRKEGAQALTHGYREKKSHNAVDASLKKQVLEPAQSIYWKTGPRWLFVLWLAAGDLVAFWFSW